MKTKKILYWVATGLFSLLMLFSASMYFFNYEEVAQTFTKLGHPSYVVYPLAVLKLLGLGVILSNRGGALKEWAYAGFFFNFVLAFFAHFMNNDGEHMGALIGIILVLSSYFLGKQVRP
ncbi:DoxX family protein [Spongiimicrobium sp. 2-473A-2-J]|uniref:DoxX family protein n=1 Tax=Eudoraea algarum TaxID=3417568 RepID=UPI003D36B9E2